MNGTEAMLKPEFLENEELPPSYNETPDPYKDAPGCHINLLELSRYARKIGKKLIELTKEEVKQPHLKMKGFRSNRIRVEGLFSLTKII